MTTPAMTPSLLKIDHIHVYVANRGAAEGWYARVLGLHRHKALEFWAKDGGPLTLENASSTVHIALFERPAEKCRSTIAFDVSGEELLAWQTHLEQVLGSKVRIEDHQVSWSIYFQDPDANPYEITTYEYEYVAQRVKRFGV